MDWQFSGPIVGIGPAVFAHAGLWRLYCLATGGKQKSDVATRELSPSSTLATTDPLTCIANRRHFDELAVEIERALASRYAAIPGHH